MNIFRKIKDTLATGSKKIFFNRKKQDTLIFILKKLQQRKSNLEDRPSHLNAKQWLDILNAMIFAFDAKKSKNLKSKFRRKVQYSKVDKGFKLFQKYIKDL